MIGIIILTLLGVFAVFSLMIYPRTFADMAFENRMNQELEQKGELRMTDITGFDWDTMYYSWDGYKDIGSIGTPIDDKYNLFKSSDHEVNDHLLFLKDGVLVKQVIICIGTVKLDFKPYLDMGYEDSVVAFTPAEAVFKTVNEKGYDRLVQADLE